MTRSERKPTPSRVGLSDRRVESAPPKRPSPGGSTSSSGHTGGVRGYATNSAAYTAASGPLGRAGGSRTGHDERDPRAAADQREHRFPTRSERASVRRTVTQGVGSSSLEVADRIEFCEKRGSELRLATLGARDRPTGTATVTRTADWTAASDAGTSTRHRVRPRPPRTSPPPARRHRGARDRRGRERRADVDERLQDVPTGRALDAKASTYTWLHSRRTRI